MAVEAPQILLPVFTESNIDVVLMLSRCVTLCADHRLCNHTLAQMHSQLGVPPQNWRLTSPISVRALQLPEPRIFLVTPEVVKN